MGAWGAGLFANDDAADWAGDLADGGSARTVRRALKGAADLSADDYLESPAGSEALAAAEVVAAAAGHPTHVDAYSEDALAWGVDPEAARAWTEAVEDLRRRLSA